MTHVTGAAAMTTSPSPRISLYTHTTTIVYVYRRRETASISPTKFLWISGFPENSTGLRCTVIMVKNGRIVKQ